MRNRVNHPKPEYSAFRRNGTAPAAGFRVGDRVVGHVIADWTDGEAPPILYKKTLGISLPGVLCEHVIFRNDRPKADGRGVLLNKKRYAAGAWISTVSPGTGLDSSTSAERAVSAATGSEDACTSLSGGAAATARILASSSDERLGRAKTLGAWRASTVGRRRHGMKPVPSLPPPHAGETGGG